MNSLSELYPPEFFSEWGSSNATYVESAQKISRRIYECFQPRTVADLGCGCGIYTQCFRDLGAKVLSLDGVRPPAEHSYPMDLVIEDLSEPFVNRWGEFDMAICFEVGEHIAPEKADVFLKNVLQFSDRVLLSCAPPFQGGHLHVNEQPKRYWVQKMAELGYLYNRVSTGLIQEALMKDPPPHIWMFMQISVYDKITDPARVEKNMPFKLRYDAKA